MKPVLPPHLADKLFDWFCGNARVDDLKGDLHEWFFININTKPKYQLKLLYWKQILSLIFSYSVRQRKAQMQSSMYSSNQPSLSMLQNYLKVAIRNLYQYKYFSMLNVLGLAIGMSISLLLIALVSYVETYDNFHENKADIYTIVSERIEGVNQYAYATAPAILANQLQGFTSIQEVVRIKAGFFEEVKLAKGKMPISGYFVEPNFLDVFSYTILSGNARIALAKANSLVLTESAALRFFNSIDAVGKTLELEQGGIFEVGAVMKDHPKNSHLKFEALVSYATLPEKITAVDQQWMKFDREYIYLLLKHDTDLTELQKTLHNISKETYANLPVKATFGIQHLSDITMGPDYRQAIGPKWEKSGLIVFIVIAALILLPACFNYTNISIARALKRAKEIGLRKTMGGVKHQIFLQFITETVVITLAALGVAILLFLLARDEFKSMMASSSSLDLSLTPKMILWFLIFALFTGVIAGLFPALYFGQLNPIQALKNKIPGSNSTFRIRKILNVLQFTLSFGFILALVVFNRQYHYSANFNFGFSKANILNIPLQGVSPDLVKTEFSGLSAVEKITFASDVLGLGYSNVWVKNVNQDSLEVAQVFVDSNYLPSFNLTLLAGTNFTDEASRQENSIIVNEEFLKAYQIEQPTDALGRTFDVEGKPLTIIGVVKNFHFASLRLPISKFFFRQNPEYYSVAQLTVRADQTTALFTQLEERWNKVSDQKMIATFFERDLQESYSMYRTLLKIIGFLGFLAVTISVLGMLGMVVYTSETKAKEVSIRKVMGASPFKLTYLLSKDYMKIMLLSIIIGAPATVFLLNWLLPMIQYYSVSLSIWDILLSTIVLISIGVATIASQTYQAAQRNPAELLRSE